MFLILGSLLPCLLWMTSTTITLTTPKDAEGDKWAIMNITTTSSTPISCACCQLWSYLMGHKPHLCTPSHWLLQKRVGWSSLIQMKLHRISGSAWSKGKRCEPGSQISKSWTQKPGYQGIQQDLRAQSSYLRRGRLTAPTDSELSET